MKSSNVDHVWIDLCFGGSWENVHEPLSGFRLSYQRNGKVYLLTDNEDVERFIAYISVSSDDVTLYVAEPRSSEVGSVAGSNQLSFSTPVYGAQNLMVPPQFHHQANIVSPHFQYQTQSQNPQPFPNPNPNQLSAPNSDFRIDQLDDDEPIEKIVSTSQYSKFDLGQYPNFDLGQYSDFDDFSEKETDHACNDFDIGQYPNFNDETAVAEEDVVDDNEEEVTTVNEHVEHLFCNSYNPEEEKEEEEIPKEKSPKKMPREYNWNMPELLHILEEELVKIAIDCYTKIIRIKKDDCFDTKKDLKIALYTKCVEDGYQLKVNKSSKDRFETRCMVDKNWGLQKHRLPNCRLCHTPKWVCSMFSASSHKFLVLVNGVLASEETAQTKETISMATPSIHLVKSCYRWPIRSPSLSSPLANSSRNWLDRDDVAILLYSSGTTGASKGMLSSHRNLMALVQAFSNISTPEETYICTILMFHIYGFRVFAIGKLANRTKVVILLKFDMNEMMSVVDAVYRRSSGKLSCFTCSVEHEERKKNI
ncbi:hypothetical protein F3Y22_tig00110773pilonHSYRG00116 [Hibiscus syriacus]|uniref:AMP-dependent synthetase/ligase domain-containing protein n=1 Tax=Hibiscus syriacus TaxID=106335 RepID=A0A6A2ZTR0_HIBSY|nr:hypothetical protein F3Y22_tig00110773pilonHSYRG00116 [Hibiscus syriacus]